MIRGLLHRGGSTVMIFAAALVASAAAATGPVYYAAARTSILHDTVASTSYLGRGFDANVTGAVNRLMSPFEPLMRGELGRDLGGRANAGRLFAPPVEALETNALDIRRNATIPLVWRGGVCAQPQIRGSCPVHRNEVVISNSLSSSLALHHPWRIGQRLRFPGWGTLTITGIYTHRTSARTTGSAAAPPTSRMSTRLQGPRRRAPTAAVRCHVHRACHHGRRAGDHAGHRRHRQQPQVRTPVGGRRAAAAQRDERAAQQRAADRAAGDRHQ